MRADTATVESRAIPRENRWWIGFLLLGAAAIAIYYTVPIFLGAVPLRVLVYCAVSASAALAVFLGVHRHRPGHRAPWIVIGLSQIVAAAADTTFYTAHYVFSDPQYPSIADVLYLGHYPLLVAGVVMLIRRRRSDRDLPGLLDAVSLTVVAGLLSWVFAIGPQTRLGTSLLVELTCLAYPLMDLVLFLVALRLFFGAGRRGAPFVLLIGWLAAVLTADTVYVLQRLAVTYDAGNFLDAIWLTGNLLLGACALHPGMVRLTLPADVPAPRLSWPRLAALLAGALIGPFILVLQNAKGEQQDVPVLAAGCAVLFALTATRLAGLAVDQRRLAITDGLTRLRSRRYFEARLADEVARTRRFGGPLGVVILDVDRFKSINERFGHSAGDRVLVEVAERLRAVAGPDAVLARYGGEEFALIATGADADNLTRLAERLRHGVSRHPIAVSGRTSLTVTVSAGAAAFGPHYGTASALVSVADRALYLAKGSDRVVASTGDDVDYLDQVADQVDLRLAAPGRSTAIAEWARTVADHLGHDASLAHRAGRLLSVGMIVLPDDLTAAELAEDRTHPEAGARLVAAVPDHAAVAEVIRLHHEHWDGSGKPEGVAGNDILAEARVLAVCDAWADLRSAPRSLPRDRAERELRAGRGSTFDPEVVDAFLELVGKQRVGDLAAGAKPGARLS